MLKVHYFNVDVDAQKNAVCSAENAAAFSVPPMLKERKRTGRLATQELEGWVLDGAYYLVDEQVGIPFWSDDISGTGSGYLGAGLLGTMTLNEQKSKLQKPAILTVETEPCSIPGLTFVFDTLENNWCSSLTIRWYLYGELLQEQQAAPDKAQYLVDCPVEQFDRLEVLFEETNRPGRYVKLQQLYLGHLLIFGRQELKSVSLLNEADPSLGELTVDTMTVEVQDPEKRNMRPRKSQQVELYWDGALLASYYVQSCTRQDLHQYTFVCGSVVGQLEDTFLGGIYEQTPLEQIITQIMGEYPFKIDSRLGNKTVTGYLPVCTRRQALQQVSFAVGGLVSTYGSGHLRLLPLPQSVNAQINRDSIFLGASMETAENVSRIEVLSHSYIPAQEQELLLEETLSGQKILLTFPTPHHSYEVTGGTLLEQGANHIVIDADGPVTVRAGMYRHNTVRHTRTLSSQGQIRKVEEATLIGPDNVEALLSRLEKVYSMDQTLRQSIVTDGHAAGGYTTTEDPWGNAVKGYITQVHNELTPAGRTAKVVVLGTRCGGR